MRSWKQITAPPCSNSLNATICLLCSLNAAGTKSGIATTPLFAESLQYLARQRLDEAGVKSLFEKASDWYEYHGLFDEAIETALTAKLFERAMALIEKFIEIHDLSELRTLGRWLENIPQQEILRHPVICFTYAQVILYSTDRFAPATAARIEPFLRAAESAWRAEEDHRRLGQLLSFRGNVAWWQGDFQKAFEYARQSLDELPEHDVFWRGNSLLIVSYEALNAGRILEAQDQVLEARALLGAAQNIYGVLAAISIPGGDFLLAGRTGTSRTVEPANSDRSVGDESMLDDQGIAALSLAHIAYERNDLDQAEQFASARPGSGVNNARTKCCRCRQPFGLHTSMRRKAIRRVPVNCSNHWRRRSKIRPCCAKFKMHRRCSPFGQMTFHRWNGG